MNFKGKLRVWLDDFRPVPIYSDFDIAIRKPDFLFPLIEANMVGFISFDHDLGERYRTGYDVASHIERLAAEGKIDRIEWKVHSANPVGVDNIVAAMKSADRFWAGTEAKCDSTPSTTVTDLG